MSRSYKKHLGFVDRDPWSKNYANRRLRRLKPSIFDTDQVEPVVSGSSYKKYSCSYDICDFKCVYHGGNSEIERTVRNRPGHWTLILRPRTEEQIKKEIQHEKVKSRI